MKKLLILILVIVTALYSCRRSTTTTIVADPLAIPWNMDSLMPGYSIHPIDYSKLNVDGILVACKFDGNITDTFGSARPYYRSWQVALFRSGPSMPFVAAPVSVSVNATPLNDDPIGFFIHYDSVPVWNENSINHWYASASGSIPLIDTTVPGTMPAFTGILPVNIDTNIDFSFSFNSSNTTDGDSAFVILYGSRHGPMRSNIVSAGAGTAVIPVSQLKNADNCSWCSLTGFPGDPNTYSGGLIVLVIYNHHIYTIGGKKFAFVKQREIIGVARFH